MDSNKYLYLPLEIIDREIDGKILLALTAIERGWTVYIGQRQKLYRKIYKLPKGIFLLKSIVPGDLVLMKKLIKNNFRIACLDEEGIIQRPEEFNKSIRYNKKTLELVDIVMAYSHIQHAYFKKYFPKSIDKIIITGNPKIDFLTLLSKSKFHGTYIKINKIKERDGFLLFATSFGNANHILGGKELAKFSYESTLISPTLEQIKFGEAKRNLASLMFKEYKKLLITLAENFKEKIIIIRPHPSEADAPWIDYSTKYSNVKFNREGPIAPWILLSDYLIHFGSTISVEANMLGKKAIQLIPSDNDMFKSLLVKDINKFSINFNKINDIIDFISNKNNILKNNQKLSNEFQKIKYNNSSIKIINELEKINKKHEKFFNNTIFLNSLTIGILKQIIEKIRDFKEILIRIMIQNKNIQNTIIKIFSLNKIEIELIKNNHKYRKTKYFKMDVKYIKDRLELTNKLLGNKTSEYVVRQYSTNVFKIMEKYYN